MSVALAALIIGVANSVALFWGVQASRSAAQINLEAARLNYETVKIIDRWKHDTDTD